MRLITGRFVLSNKQQKTFGWMVNCNTERPIRTIVTLQKMWMLLNIPMFVHVGRLTLRLIKNLKKDGEDVFKHQDFCMEALDKNKMETQE